MTSNADFSVVWLLNSQTVLNKTRRRCCFFVASSSESILPRSVRSHSHLPVHHFSISVVAWEAPAMTSPFNFASMIRRILSWPSTSWATPSYWQSNIHANTALVHHAKNDQGRNFAKRPASSWGQPWRLEQKEQAQLIEIKIYIVRHRVDNKFLVLTSWHFHSVRLADHRTTSGAPENEILRVIFFLASNRHQKSAAERAREACGCGWFCG